MTDFGAAAGEALRLATISPLRAQESGRRIEQLARRHGDWAAVSTAARARGVAALHLRDLQMAASHLRVSVAAGHRASSPRLVCEARMSLAATLLVRGSPRRAMTEIESALQDVEGVVAARARTQRAAILQVVGRDEEALADLRRALPVLRQANDVQWQVRALSNRSLLLISRRSFASAEADLVSARKLCNDHGLGLSGAYAEQNLGCLKASRGEVVAALDHFDRAEEGYRREGLSVASLLADRAQVLLSVRLVDEARIAAEAAVSGYETQKRYVSIPDARLLLSTVALVQGDSDAAKAAAEQAARGFGRLGRTDAVALAQWARLQAIVASRPRTVSPAQARRIAAELDRVGWTVPSLEAQVLAGRLALSRGRRADARRDLNAASRARHAGPADARARAWLAEALLRQADGRRRAAAVALSTGLRIVEEHQSTLGATELRAHVSVHRGALASLGLKQALEDKNARRVLGWAERGRASAMLLRAPEPPDDPILARDLADLRTTMTEIGDRRAAGRPSSDLLQRQVQLERIIADRCRRLPARPGSARARPRAVGDLAADLADAALVEYVEIDRMLHAVTLVDGRARLHSLGPVDEIGESLVHLPFALHRLARPRSSASRAGAHTLLTKLRSRYDALLIRPFARDIADRPLVIVPTGVLQSMPWAVLPSCGGRPVTVAPSATLWHNAVNRSGPASEAHVVLVAGPGLPGAREEAQAVGALYPGSLRLLDEAATVPAVCAAMDGAALVHMAAHGRLRSDNPLFSSLLMYDGQLTVYDLERLNQSPEHVVLAACETARPHVMAGDEVLGLAAALLAQGTASLVAPIVAVLDAATVPLMSEYHRQLIAGEAPAFALSAALEKAAADDYSAWAAGVGFVCMGAGLQGPGPSRRTAC